MQIKKSLSQIFNSVADSSDFLTVLSILVFKAVERCGNSAAP